VSFVAFYSRLRITDPQVHINAFEQVDSPERISEIINGNLDNFLKKELEVDEENNFPPKLTARILRTILQNINFEEVLSDAWVKNVKNITNWMKGDSEFTLYFPKDLIIENYETAGSDDNFINDLVTISGYSDLPQCDAVSDINEASYLIGEVECGGPLLNEYIENDFKDRIGVVNGQTFLEGFLNAILGDVDEQTTLTGESRENFNNSDISKVPMILDKIKIYSISGLLIALVSSLIAIKLSDKPALAFLRIIGNVGVLIVLLSLLSKVAVRIIADFLLWGNIKLPPEVYNDLNAKLIMDYVKDLTGAILDKILVEFMIIGIVLIVIVIALYLIFKFTRLIRNDVNDEDEDEESNYEDEDDESEEGEPHKDNKKFEDKLLSHDSDTI
jgi:Na+-transporting methylmalonyl-CoA/oxaloacetate decarboxylase gamma subunit